MADATDDYTLTESEIRDAVFKSSIGDGVFALFFYRPLTYLLFKKTVKRPINPSYVTGISFIMYLLAAFALVADTILTPFSFSLLDITIESPFIWLLIFLIAYNLAMITDSLDGAIARAYKIGSPKGRLVDSFADGFGNILLFIALSIRFPNMILYLGILFMAYLTYTVIALAYMTEVAVRGIKEFSTAKVRMIRGFPIRLVFGSPDYFCVAIQLIVLASWLNLWFVQVTQFFALGWLAFFIFYFFFKTRRIGYVLNSENADDSA